MDIKELLNNTLSQKEIVELLGDKRVWFLHCTKPIPPYLEYQVLSEEGSLFSDNLEDFADYTVQIDIFSKEDYEEIEKAVKAKMIEAGFMRTMSYDLYEAETGFYRKVFRFNISLQNN